MSVEFRKALLRESGIFPVIMLMIFRRCRARERTRDPAGESIFTEVCDSGEIWDLAAEKVLLRERSISAESVFFLKGEMEISLDS